MLRSNQSTWKPSAGNCLLRGDNELYPSQSLGHGDLVDANVDNTDDFFPISQITSNVKSYDVPAGASKIRIYLTSDGNASYCVGITDPCDVPGGEIRCPSDSKCCGGPKAACCPPDGAPCTEEYEVDCTGLYNPDKTCEEVTCPDLEGACCVKDPSEPCGSSCPDGSATQCKKCIFTTQSDCALQSGDFLGGECVNADCNPTGCSKLGTYCLPNTGECAQSCECDKPAGSSWKAGNQSCDACGKGCCKDASTSSCDDGPLTWVTDCPSGNLIKAGTCDDNCVPSTKFKCDEDCNCVQDDAGPYTECPDQCPYWICCPGQGCVETTTGDCGGGVYPTGNCKEADCLSSCPYLPESLPPVTVGTVLTDYQNNFYRTSLKGYTLTVATAPLTKPQADSYNARLIATFETSFVNETISRHSSTFPEAVILSTEDLVLLGTDTCNICIGGKDNQPPGDARWNCGSPDPALIMYEYDLSYMCSVDDLVVELSKFVSNSDEYDEIYDNYAYRVTIKFKTTGQTLITDFITSGFSYLPRNPNVPTYNCETCSWEYTCDVIHVDGQYSSFVNTFPETFVGSGIYTNIRTSVVTIQGETFKILTHVIAAGENLNMIDQLGNPLPVIYGGHSDESTSIDWRKITNQLRYDPARIESEFNYASGITFINEDALTQEYAINGICDLSDPGLEIRGPALFGVVFDDNVKVYDFRETLSYQRGIFEDFGLSSSANQGSATFNYQYDGNAFSPYKYDVIDSTRSENLIQSVVPFGANNNYKFNLYYGQLSTGYPGSVYSSGNYEFDTREDALDYINTWLLEYRISGVTAWSEISIDEIATNELKAVTNTIPISSTVIETDLEIRARLYPGDAIYADSRIEFSRIATAPNIINYGNYLQTSSVYSYANFYNSSNVNASWRFVNTASGTGSYAPQTQYMNIQRPISDFAPYVAVWVDPSAFSNPKNDRGWYIFERSGFSLSTALNTNGNNPVRVNYATLVEKWDPILETVPNTGTANGKLNLEDAWTTQYKQRMYQLKEYVPGDVYRWSTPIV